MVSKACRRARAPTPRRPATTRSGRASGRLPLGRWAGVAVSVHWSALLALALFAYLLATQALPVARPGYSQAGYWLTGVLTAGVFLATVLVHELAHTVAARHFGLRVRSITLWMLGGSPSSTTSRPARARTS